MVEQLVGGRYQLIEPTARGTRATTYRAVDRETGEAVAVRLVDEALAADPRFVAHFHRQAHGAAEMAHPNVTRLHDYGRFENTYFLAEEWVEGTPLARYLEARGPLPLSDALAIAGAVAGGLAGAHQAGLVHGGVGPEDVTIRADGVVKLGAFGIAKPPGMPTRPETAEHRALAYYISPEQAQGEAPTPASDVYSLGALLFRMLAGRPPFEGATPLAVALKHVNEDPPDLRSPRPDASPDVGSLVMRTLAKQPSRRYRDGAALEQAIRALPGYRPDLRPAALVAAGPRSLLERLATPPVSWLAGIFLALLILTVGAALLVMAGAAARQEPSPPATSSPTAATTVQVPALVGLPLNEAQRLAAERQLQLAVSERLDPQIPAGSVLEQSPPAGEHLAPGDTVRVVVSQGPAEVAVPNLAGGDLDQARAALDRAGLLLGSTSDRASSPEDRGRVIGQNPPPGARVAEGSYVDLTVGAGPPATATPPPSTPTAPLATPTAPAMVPPTVTPSPSPSPAEPTPSPTDSPTPTPPAPSPTTPPVTPTETPAAPSPTSSPSPLPTSTPPEATPTPTVSPDPAGLTATPTATVGADAALTPSPTPEGGEA